MKNWIKRYFKFMFVVYAIYGISEVMVRNGQAMLNAKKAKNGQIKDFEEPEWELVLNTIYRNLRTFIKQLIEYVNIA